MSAAGPPGHDARVSRSAGETGLPDPANATPAFRRSVRVVIVDDDRRVRQSLSGLMSLREGIEVVGTAGDGDAALALVSAAHPDTVLLDLRLPEASDGLGLLAELRQQWPAVRVVAMSVQVSLRSAAMSAGASVFVAKSGQAEAIGDALLAAG